jgi:hypothetical protein
MYDVCVVKSKVIQIYLHYSFFNHGPSRREGCIRRLFITKRHTVLVLSTMPCTQRMYRMCGGQAPYIVEPWLRRLVFDISARRPAFTPGLVHVGFVVKKLALGQIIHSLCSLDFSCQYHSAVALHTHVTWGWTRSVGGSSSETQSYRIDMTNNKKLHTLLTISLTDMGVVSRSGRFHSHYQLISRFND